jgi:hypothetical protein
MFQTVILDSLLRSSKEECFSIQNELPNYQTFIGHLSQAYEMWDQGGADPSCAHMCEDVLAYAVNYTVCSVICKLLLPVGFLVYGRPWIPACVMHRHICVVSKAVHLYYSLVARSLWSMNLAVPVSTDACIRA